MRHVTLKIDHPVKRSMATSLHMKPGTVEKPDLSDLKVFGCIAYAHIPDGQRKKLLFFNKS